MTNRRPTQRQPGRPPGSTGRVCAALVASARRRFAAQGFEAVSLRAIAAGAGVNPAMIRYYFGDKTGLYEAVLVAATEPLFARLEWLEDEHDIDALVNAFAAAHLEVVARDPWLPPLLMREVLLPDGRLRERFIERFAGRVGRPMETVLARAARDGVVRADLEPRLNGLALLGLVMFPVIAAPLVREVFGVDAAVSDRERLIRHLRSLFLDGVRPRSGPRPGARAQVSG